MIRRYGEFADIKRVETVTRGLFSLSLLSYRAKRLVVHTFLSRAVYSGLFSFCQADIYVLPRNWHRHTYDALYQI